MSDGLPKVLSCKDFETGLIPAASFQIEVAELKIGTIIHNHVQLEISYDERSGLMVHCVLPGNQNALFTDNEIPITAISSFFRDNLEFFATKQKQFSVGFSEVHLQLKHEVICFRPCSDLTMLEAVLINGPEIIFASKSIDFDLGDFQMNLKEFSAVRDFRKSKELPKGAIVATGVISLIRKDGAAFSADVGTKVIHRFNRFLTFVRGAYCSVGNFVGHSEASYTRPVQLGFTSTDPFKSSIGWCDQGIIKNLPEIYAQYSKTVTLESNKRPFLRAIEFYRASNIIRESSLEMAIVASHTALETLVSHLLTERAGWSKSKLNKKGLNFSEKLRAAATFIAINCDPLEHASDLQARSKEMSDADAYTLISLFRNNIVHPGKSVTYTGLELVGVWNLSQWLCELLLFYWFGYRGQMNDRRKLGGWRGDSVLVPLPSVNAD